MVSVQHQIMSMPCTGVCAAAPDFAARGERDGPELCETQLRHASDREAATPAVALATGQSSDWADTQPGAVSSQPCTTA